MAQKKKQEHRYVRSISILLSALLISGLSGGTAITIDNPYEGVVWTGSGAWQRHKANFHTHTTESDGLMTPDTVIDHYYDNGYTILAITDHNKITWPWTGWSRNPDALGMLAIPGNEFSYGHHRGSFFNTIDGNPGSDVKATLTRVADAGGLSMLNHPGRYSEPIAWYTDVYTSVPTCFGLEVFNQGDRYPDDRATWDAVLTQLMPGRPVWGYSNDDMHAAGNLFKCYNVLFVEELTEAQVRRALQSGRSYFSFEPGGSGDALAPSIGSVTVDTAAMTITLSAAAYDSIQWISEGRVVGTGASYSYAQSRHLSYVRARLIGDRGETHTQPFGIRSSLQLASVVLIGKGGEWSYLDDGSDQRTAWRETDFDDAAWVSGPAKFGYGDGNEATTVSYGGDAGNKHVTTYFRKEFTLADDMDVEALSVSLLKDDGAVIYLNGTEVYRANMPDGPVTFTTFASAAIGGGDETAYVKTDIGTAPVVAGKNVIAVEIHQVSGTSSDIGFDMSLTALIDSTASAVDPHADQEPPVPTGMTAPSGTSIEVTFSEPVTQATGGDRANYAVSGGITVAAVSLYSNGYTATLTTSQMTGGTEYTVTVDDVEDTAGNAMAAPVSVSGTYTAALIEGFACACSGSYRWEVLVDGGGMYTDRDYVYSSVPAELDGGRVLLTAMDDKTVSASDDFINFTLTDDAAVYVLYTEVNATLTDVWLNAGGGWTAEDYTVSTTIPGAGEAERKVVRKSYSAGSTVSLGGHGGTDPATSMYTVVVVPGAVTGGVSVPAFGREGCLLPEGESWFTLAGMRITGPDAAGIYVRIAPDGTASVEVRMQH